jgi:microcystin-dependent protein
MTALSTLLGSRNWSDVPCGTFFPYGGSSAPTGFLMCDGSAVSRTTYSDLFAVFSTTFGAGDGSTTFNVPDLRGRGVIGAGTGTGGGASGTGAPTGGSALTARANGAWLGEETHVLTEAELASHGHPIYTNGASTPSRAAVTTSTTNYASSSAYISLTGSDAAHNNVQPVIASNWIVKCVRAFSGSQSFLSRGFIDGLITSNAADADHDITISVGACRDSSDAYNMTLASALTKRIDASWAAGDAAGGLFSGSVANATWYHVFLIRKDSDGAIDAGFDTSVVAANKPAGYSTYRRIGSVLTNGSANILSFTQTGNRFELNSAAIAVDYNGVPPTSLTALTVTAPPNTDALMRIYGAVASGNTFYLVEGKTSGEFWIVCAISSSTPGFSSVVAVPVDGNSQVRHYSGATLTNGQIYTQGWIDPRGRDA